ncbi:MafI family immunity protein [Burkholderia aenigmatica]|uniref:MafI family immunity protein n=1 Tax=Burkholderia aenigmatica TaxID=2015348 RepID=UPI00117820A5
MEDLERLRSLGERFRNRLSDQEINFSLGYIDFNEASLALDVLCNYLFERGASISKDEYGEISLLNGNFGAPLGKKTLLCLKSLICACR